ncbi:nucleoside/nucleotide kinase family protein [Streptomyces sp. NPDC058045]|uniref:nucleoside/nucleotide kinase family protein n=1 Tax=Streptomyces sp. NPDC058045 TaxID=3346311 RepID=UPI0036EF1902
MTSPLTPDELVERARGLADAAEREGGRRILGIAGPPGAGKSTLAAHLTAALGPRAALVPMDGHHLADAVLRAHGSLGRKGAPDTFDAHGYAALLHRLRTPHPGETVYAPAFDREVEQPVAGSLPVSPGTPLIVTEGNYLLLDEEPWPMLRPLLDEVWWVELPDAERVRRLIARHERFGKPPGEARGFVLRSDEANARRVAPGRQLADLVVEFEPGPAPAP